MSGDQQECVKKAPPVRLGEILSHGMRERRQRGHDLGGELTGVQIKRLAPRWSYSWLTP